MGSVRRKGVILGYTNIIVKNAVNLLYTPMLLSFVGQGDYGVFQTANSFIFSLTLLSFGFSGAYVRFYTMKKAEGDDTGVRVLNGTYLAVYVAISVAAVAIGMVLAANAGNVLSTSFTHGEVALARDLMSIMSVNVAATLMSTVFDAYVIVHEEFVFQQTRQILTTLAVPVLALILLGDGMGAVGVAVAQLVVSITLLVLNARFAIVRLGMRFSTRIDGSLLRQIASFSAWIFANQVCDLVNQNVPNVILGIQRGAEVVAVFAVALQIRNVFISLSTTMSHVFIPQVNRAVAEGWGDWEITKIFVKVGRYQMMLLAWVYGGFAVLGRFFVSRWAGESFGDAYWLLLAMALPLLVPLSQNVGIEVQKAKNMHKTRSVVYLLVACVSVGFTYIFSPTLGYWAPAIAYAGSIALGNGLFMNWYYHTRVGLDMGAYWRSVAPVMLCAGSSCIMCMLGASVLPIRGWVGFAAWGAAYTLLLGGLLWLTAISSAEKASVTGKVRRMLGGKDD